MNASLLSDSTLQQLVLEQAKALAAELEATANNAPDGQVINACELLLLSRGRDFLRQILTAAAQHQADTVEKRGRRPVPVPADTPAATKAARPSRS